MKYSHKGNVFLDQLLKSPDFNHEMVYMAAKHLFEVFPWLLHPPFHILNEPN